MNTTVEFYTDQAGEWRWRIVAAENGQTLAASSEGYSRHSDATTAAHRVVMGAMRGDTITFLRVERRELDYTALAEGVHNDEGLENAGG